MPLVSKKSKYTHKEKTRIQVGKIMPDAKFLDKGASYNLDKKDELNKPMDKKSYKLSDNCECEHPYGNHTLIKIIPPIPTKENCISCDECVDFRLKGKK